MADTQRSKSALATLFADNATGDISPQDLRDFLESMDLPYGAYYISSSAATTPAGAGTFLKALGTTTAIAENNFTHSTNRLTYNGTPDCFAVAMASVSMTCAGVSKIVSLGFAENGAILTPTRIDRKIGTGSDIGAAGVVGTATLSTNDYLELWVANQTDTGTVTYDYAYVIVLGLFI
jgi:hypothetical protein